VMPNGLKGSVSAVALGIAIQRLSGRPLYDAVGRHVLRLIGKHQHPWRHTCDEQPEKHW
jgi:hypothetical protein